MCPAWATTDQHRVILVYIGWCSTRFLKYTKTWNTERPYNHRLQSKILSLPNIFRHHSHINHQNQGSQSSYKKFRLTYLSSNLTHRKCEIMMRLDLILMVTGTRWYEHIIYSWVIGCGGTILVGEHHSGAQRSSSPTLTDSSSSPLWWCTRAPTTLNISITTYPAIG